jgi:hypothetical protein
VVSFTEQDYSLDKSSAFPYIPIMDSKSQRFFGLEAAAEARIACRKSLLMDASNFLVGTFFSKSFLPFSMRGSR